MPKPPSRMTTRAPKLIRVAREMRHQSGFFAFGLPPPLPPPPGPVGPPGPGGRVGPDGPEGAPEPAPPEPAGLWASDEALGGPGGPLAAVGPPAPAGPLAAADGSSVL